MSILVEDLRQLIAYDAASGQLTWLPRAARYFKRSRDCDGWNTKYAGKPALNTKTPNGYLAGHIFKNTQFAHRVAWALHTGSWPADQIDHIDGNRANNTISNLREASPSENQRNVKQRVDNTSGAKGVDLQAATGLWRARIVHNGRRVELGRFENITDAVQARAAAEARFQYHPNHGRLA